MTRTAIRHTLSALAAVALVCTVAVGPALSDQQGTVLSNSLKSSQAVINGPRQPNALKGLAAHSPAQRNTTTRYEFRWWQDYSNGGR